MYGVAWRAYTTRVSHGAALRGAHTAYRIPYTVYRIPYTVYRIPYTVYGTPYTVHRIPYTVYRTYVAMYMKLYKVRVRGPTPEVLHMIYVFIYQTVFEYLWLSL